MYYFDSDYLKDHADGDAEQAVNNAKADWALVMACYNDARYASFWQPFTKRKQEVSYNDLHKNEKALKQYRLGKVWKTYANENLVADKRMVDKIWSQLTDLHGVNVDEVPNPILALYKDWNPQDWEAGWHTWEVNEKSPDVRKELKKQEGARLYICGEAYSNDQGWMEVALSTTCDMLKEILVNSSEMPKKERRSWRRMTKKAP